MGDLAVYFYGKDVFVELISLLVVLFILFYIIRYYRLDTSKKGQYRLLIASFSFLALSFFAKIVSNMVIYSTSLDLKQVDVITFAYQGVLQKTSFLFWGLVFYKIFSLLGFYLLYLVYVKKQTTLHSFFVPYLLIVLGYLSTLNHHFYHLTAFVLLAIITHSFFKRYSCTKNQKTCTLTISFALIAFSQAVFIFFWVNSLYYIFGEIIQLFGYILLLFTFAKVIFDAQKTR